MPTRSFDMQATAKMLLKDDTKQTPLKGLQTYDDAEKEAAVQEEDLGNMLENLHFRLNEASVPADEEQVGSPSPVAVKVRQGRKTSGAETGQSDHKNSGRKHTTWVTREIIAADLRPPRQSTRVFCLKATWSLEKYLAYWRCDSVNLNGSIAQLRDFHFPSKYHRC